MPKLGINRIGERFYRLVIVAKDSKYRYWICRCDCGIEKSIHYSNLTGTGKKHPTKSCGCFGREFRPTQIKHGHARHTPGGETRIYKSWNSMIQRCSNPNCKSFKDYGERGITFCERWKEFTNFLSDMGPMPKDRTLDRINNEGNYEPGNCRWATMKEQSNNRREASIRSDNTSGVKGVGFHRSTGKWLASGWREGKSIHLGLFELKDDAIKARSIFQSS